LITHTVAAADVASAYDLLDGPTGNALQVVIDFTGVTESVVAGGLR